jgi:putative ABC transport system permease protein
VPWWLIGSGMLLAILSATGAAWWPARGIARTSIVSALSGRPERPRPVKRSAAVAGLLLAAGTASLVLAGDPVDAWLDVGLILAGTVTLIVGVLFLSPLAIQTLARIRGRAPVAVRLALTDLVRYRARSGTALAAISLALGIATVIVVSASSAIYSTASEGNLSDRQLMIRIGEIPGDGDVAPIAESSVSQLEQVDDVVAQIATRLDATVTDIEVAIAPGQGFDDFEGLPAIVVGTPAASEGEGTSYHVVSNVYVASPALLEHYGLDQAAIDPEAEVLTTQTGELWLLPIRDEPVNHPQHLTPGYTSLPGTFMTPEAIAARGWTSARAGWLVETSAPITAKQFADVRDLAGDADVTVEARHDQRNLASLRTGATGAGAIIALAIMAMTVGLVRSEAAGDLRILTASGATSSDRRTLTAATAAALALLGAILGMAGAYLGLGAAHIRNLDALTPVPVLHLVVLGLGLPVVAGVAGWALAGRTQPWLSRQPLD